MYSSNTQCYNLSLFNNLIEDSNSLLVTRVLFKNNKWISMNCERIYYKHNKLLYTAFTYE